MSIFIAGLIDHAMPQRSLGVVVRRLDPFDSNERPQVRLAGQQLPARPGRLGAAAAPPTPEVVPEREPHDVHLGSERGLGHRPVPYPMPPVEQLLGMTEQPPTDLGRLAAPVDHRLKIPIEVSPTELPSLDPT